MCFGNSLGSGDSSPRRKSFPVCGLRQRSPVRDARLILALRFKLSHYTVDYDQKTTSRRRDQCVDGTSDSGA
jgi:hypothetical protein